MKDSVLSENRLAPYGSDKPVRLQLGEAYMMCNDCGARIYSFDGGLDASRPCPYRKGPRGECQP